MKKFICMLVLLFFVAVQQNVLTMDKFPLAQRSKIERCIYSIINEGNIFISGKKESPNQYQVWINIINGLIEKGFGLSTIEIYASNEEERKRKEGFFNGVFGEIEAAAKEGIEAVLEEIKRESDMSLSPNLDNMSMEIIY